MAGTRRPVTTIKEQVYQIIKEDICNGVYPPGYWLQETPSQEARSGRHCASWLRMDLW